MYLHSDRSRPVTVGVGVGVGVDSRFWKKKEEKKPKKKKKKKRISKQAASQASKQSVPPRPFNVTCRSNSSVRRVNLCTR